MNLWKDGWQQNPEGSVPVPSVNCLTCLLLWGSLVSTQCFMPTAVDWLSPGRVCSPSHHPSRSELHFASRGILLGSTSILLTRWRAGVFRQRGNAYSISFLAKAWAIKHLFAVWFYLFDLHFFCAWSGGLDCLTGFHLVLSVVSVVVDNMHRCA